MSKKITGLIQKCLFCCVAGSLLFVSLAMAQGTATYDLTFTATWSASTHPTDFPSNPHFSGMIGGTHNSAVSFWDVGATASDGIKQMAELGAKGILRGEINQAISASNADAILDGPVMSLSPGSRTITFDIRPPWNLVTVTSMVAPSPDWFVGVSGLDLLDSNGDWINSHEVDLFVYDAGTDSGPTYTSPNQPTDPREAISRIADSPFLVDGSVKPVGTFRFELKNVVGATPKVSLSVDPNPVDEGDSVTVTVQLSDALSTDVAIPVTLTSGTAESGDYDSATPLSLSIVSGATEAEHVIHTYADDDVDDETFTVNLDVNNLPSEVRAGSPTSEEVTIRDPHKAAIILSVDQTSINEGDSITVTVQLSNLLSTDVMIPLMLTSGTAEPDDYDSTTPVNLDISAGNTQAMHVIQTYKDDDVEDETFTMALDTSSLPSEIVAGSPTSVEVTISDLDMPGISIPTSVEFAEGDTTFISIALTAQPSGDVTVTITGHENTDLTLDMNVLTFTTSNWGQEQTVTLTAAEDTDYLNDEVTLTLSAAGDGYEASQTLTVTITDNMGVGTEQTEEIISLALWGNYPNPLSNTTKIAFDLPAPAKISVTITDLLGRTVKTMPYKSYSGGRGHTVQVDVGNLSSGVYYYTLEIVMLDKVVRRSKAMSVVR